MSPTRPPDLVCLGNLIVDDVVFGDGTTRMGQAGGAMLYAALGAALWEARVAIVAPLGDDYPRGTLAALTACGVDLTGLRPLGRPGLRTWLLYEPLGRRVVHRLDAASHKDATPAIEDVTGRFAEARAFHLSPTPLECQLPLLHALSARSGALLSLDPHDPVRWDNVERWREALALLDLFFVSEEEFPIGDGESVPEALHAPHAGARLRHLLLKLGDRGGIVFDTRTGHETRWAPRVTGTVDPTGAGDAFAGGFLSGLLAGEEVAGCLERGIVSASFALEDWGADGLLAANPGEARRRRREWYGVEARA